MGVGEHFVDDLALLAEGSAVEQLHVVLSGRWVVLMALMMLIRGVCGVD